MHARHFERQNGHTVPGCKEFFAFSNRPKTKNTTLIVPVSIIKTTQFCLKTGQFSGAPNENIVQNHLNIALLNVFWYLNGRYKHIFIP